MRILVLANEWARRVGISTNEKRKMRKEPTLPCTNAALEIPFFSSSFATWS
jgi:hypothetical protein